MRICVADDEQEVRESIINKLRQIATDSEIFDVGFGYEAMRQLEVIRPDLVLLDIRMPEMDGLSMLERLRTVSPNSQAAILSGYDEFTYARNALQFGAADYLLKPADPEELAHLVSRVQGDLERDLLANLEGLRDSLEASDLHLQCTSILRPGLWLDERIYKRICMDASEERIDRLCSALPLLFRFELNGQQGAVLWVDQDHDAATFNKPDQFCSQLEAAWFRWESESFFAGMDGDEERRSPVHRETRNRVIYARKKILELAKSANIPVIENVLQEWFISVSRLPLHNARIECAKLMASLDEYLTRSDRLVLPNLELVGYWLQWIKKQTTWQEAQSRITHFVLGGITALGQLKERGSQTGWMDAALQHIEKSHAIDLSLESVASSVGVHPVTLSRVFKEEMGVTFIEFVTRRKMQQAYQKIREGDRPIFDIAKELGYFDYKYFRKLFKKEYGITPIDCRKQNEFPI